VWVGRGETKWREGTAGLTGSAGKCAPEGDAGVHVRCGPQLRIDGIINGDALMFPMLVFTRA
jgi:hypothetical protein